jgi:mannose-6-phosphate isomerase-like protein (cupin superfamily)
MDQLAAERAIKLALENVSLADLGARFRSQRLSMGLSIRRVAELAMVSKTSVVQFELGRSCRPSTLAKLLSGLGLHFDRLIRADFHVDPIAPVFQSSNDLKWVCLDDLLDSGLVAPGGQAMMAAFRSFPPDSGVLGGLIEVGEATESRSHSGSEWIFALRGRSRIVVDEAIHDLEEGDSLFLPSGMSHSYSCAVKGERSTMIALRFAEPSL